MSDQIPLKYLFVVEYEDGIFFHQTQEDKSTLDEKRSQFYDVLQSGKRIHRFSLVGEGNTLTVDLFAGVFYVNGLTILLESEKLPQLPERFDLVFYRQHTHDQNVTYKRNEETDGNMFDIESLGASRHFVEYFIGWECEINGKKYIQKLAVA